MSNPWDRYGPGPRPDLSKLPLEDRARIAKPIPLRYTETYGMVCIFRNTTTSHPNGRVNISPFVPDQPESVGGLQTGLQIDCNDFSGRLPTATIILSRESAKTAMVSMLRAYRAVGGDVDAAVAASRAPDPFLGDEVYVEPEKSYE